MLIDVRSLRGPGTGHSGPSYSHSVFEARKYEEVPGLDRRVRPMMEAAMVPSAGLNSAGDAKCASVRLDASERARGVRGGWPRPR